MSDNVLIPLPTFTLPADFPWRVRFISAVDEHLRRLRATGHFRPSRFFGYYFRGDIPIGVSGNWTVTLDAEPPLVQLKSALERVTKGQFSVTSTSPNADPDFLLVHDRRDGACWLWRFEYGLRFVEAIDAVTDDRGTDQTQNRKLLGP